MFFVFIFNILENNESAMNKKNKIRKQNVFVLGKNSVLAFFADSVMLSRQPIKKAHLPHKHVAIGPRGSLVQLARSWCLLPAMSAPYSCMAPPAKSEVKSSSDKIQAIHNQPIASRHVINMKEQLPSAWRSYWRVKQETQLK